MAKFVLHAMHPLHLPSIHRAQVRGRVVVDGEVVVGGVEGLVVLHVHGQGERGRGSHGIRRKMLVG